MSRQPEFQLKEEVSMNRAIHWMVVCAVLLIAGTLRGADGEIYNCTTITRPGSYKLVSNITLTASNAQLDAGTGALTCIDIAADFVTLDLAGHTIFGPPGARLSGNGTAGIYTWYHNGIEVHSGVLTSFVDGIELDRGNGLTVEKIRAFNNEQVGIDIELGAGHRVVGNTAIGNGSDGIIFTCPAVVLGNVAEGNGYNQILGEGSGCTLSDNSPTP